MHKSIGKLFLSAAVMMMALLIIAACDNKPKIADGTIMEQVKQLVATYEGVSAEVKDGVVTLTGTVPTEEIAKTLPETIGKLPGVKSVVNKLEVKPIAAVTNTPVPSEANTESPGEEGGGD